MLSNKNKNVAVDLFCGCGGMSWGMTKRGIDVRLGVELNKKYISSFEHNFGKGRAATADLTTLTGQEILDKIELNHGELDFLVGGPPCQGFSKNVPRKFRQLESENNLLVLTFLQRCEEIRPKNIVMENVAEMKNGFESTYTEEVVSSLEQMGYDVIYKVFNAADFGVPQRRRRAFFLASRVSKLRFPQETHEKDHGSTGGLFGIKPWVSVWDAIGDLPPLNNGEVSNATEYQCSPFSDYQRLMRGNCLTVANHTSRKLAPLQYERLANLEPGQGHSDLPDHLKVKGGYSGAYGRLTEDMVAPTITRWVFHPGSGRWGHPRDIRTLTPREVARIQSFSDDFIFSGSYNDICGQLGNAVPPLLMSAILSTFSEIDIK